jgi:exopolyphosphatase/guanosine-5'-triphosphate,3'-diphosphate pyrophosphatase
MRFASIDMGSNASRLRIVEAVAPGDVREVKSMRVPVRLGHGVFVTGRLDPKTIDDAVAVLRAFHEAMEDANVHRYRAVVTASARECKNADELLRRARSEAGISLEAIDGSEEARLVRLAVGRAVNLTGRRALLADLGGGSLELTDVDGLDPLYSTSLEIGTVRLLEAFLTVGKPVKPQQERMLREYLERMLHPVVEHLSKKRYDLVIGTGGNFDAIAQLAPALRRPGTIDVRKAITLKNRLVKLSPAKRRTTFGLRADRADVIAPALYILEAITELAPTDVVLAPGVGLKEGILVELVEKYFRVWDYKREESNAIDAAIQLGRRYHFDEGHARSVESLAMTLFDDLAQLHKLGPADRLALRIATLLHDVGDFIHYASHHKHSQYVIEHSDLLGLSPAERIVVACVARYHRRSLPSPKHTSYGTLSVLDRTRVRKLSAILRIADALDREHLAKVRRVSAKIGKGVIVLEIEGKGDVSLETWTVERKALAFTKTFRRRVELRLV